MKNSTWIKYYEQGSLKEELTFNEAEKRIDVKMSELENFGIKKGERVVVRLSNSPLSVVTYLALYRLGAIVVPVSRLEDKERFEYIVSDCAANAIVDDEGPQILDACKKISFDYSVVSTIIYTSGTTGTPKGVCLSWDNWLANADSLMRHHHLNNEMIFASPLLLTHCNAHGLAMVGTYQARCKWILFDKVSPNFLEIISKERVNVLSLVPPILYTLYNSNKSWKPHKELKYILTAAAPLSPDLLWDVTNDWKMKVIQGYGLSESTNFSCTMPTDLDERDYREAMFPRPSVGVAIDGVKIRVGQDDKEEKVGEVMISSKANFNGYWGKEKIEPKEWVATGDVGYYRVIKGRRFYYLKGRLKEIINRGGEKISPVELENELYEVGLRGEFAVISIPSKKYGEEIGLVCCQKADFSVIENIPKYRRPKKIFLLENLFYTRTGKLQRRRISDFCINKNAEVIMEELNKE